MNDTPLLVTIPQAARLLGLHRSTVWEMCYNREIESIRIGRARRVVYADLKRWLEEKRREQAHETEPG